MATYATYADVAARLPQHTFSVSSKPTTTQQEVWLAYAEASIIAALQSGGNPGTYVTTAGTVQIREWATDYGEGRTRQALQSGKGDITNNGDGEKLIDDFNARILHIQTNPSLYGAMLAAGDAPEGTSRLLSYQTSNDDDLTIANGDFAPTFTRSEVF